MNFEKYMKNVSDYIVYDNTYYKGNEYIFDIQNALSSNKLIEIDYRKYEESDTPKLRIVEPYGLREIEGRWYLWAKIQGTKDDFRVFGLDRIYKLEISGGSFKRQNISILNYFKDSIGTYVLGEEPVERVKLQINDFMYHYFRSYPVHHTQRFEKNDDGYLMEIRVQINTDLVNKIFQFGDQIRVIQPKALIKEIKNRLNLIAAYYD
jgi:predicted DNA-binding transcriptional regulator YafY